MSTTRPYSPGDRGPEPSGASGMPEGAAPTVGAATEAAVSSVPTVPSGPAAGASPGADPRVRTLRLAGESGVVPLARDFARQALYAWGWLPAATADRRAAAEDVLLVVSELVTNACLHAEGPEEIVVACDNKVIRVEVSDRGTGQPAPRTPHRAGRPGGHGMFIVQRLCLDWGVVRAPGRSGKTVWAELGAPA
ncbi:ATP-binding protein [Streptomyces naphthomycinicus]|uniref:ATP-binding protein n=1 Tax=Streptomyces naphthomycinicus TaxID=2872625 RepID=UPI001CECBCB8|nr:ATP-binding protein [Streptomyces sp. TML10]